MEGSKFSLIVNDFMKFFSAKLYLFCLIWVRPNKLRAI